MATTKIKMETMIYRTTDLHLAAFLRTRNWFVRLERSEDRKTCTFAFVDDPELQNDIQAYFNDADVPAITFKNKLQDLKTLMYNT